MFVVSLVEFSKRVQNEISPKVMPKPQNFTADFADRTDRRNYDPAKRPNYAGAVKYWEIIANRINKAGWSLGWVSAIYSENDLDC